MRSPQKASPPRCMNAHSHNSECHKLFETLAIIIYLCRVFSLLPNIFESIFQKKKNDWIHSVRIRNRQQLQKSMRHVLLFEFAFLAQVHLIDSTLRHSLFIWRIGYYLFGQTNRQIYFWMETNLRYYRKQIKIIIKKMKQKQNERKPKTFQTKCEWWAQFSTSYFI